MDEYQRKRELAGEEMKMLRGSEGRGKDDDASVMEEVLVRGQSIRGTDT